MPNTADVILNVLKQGGVDRIFGVPGAGPTTQLMESATKAGVETVLVSHEAVGGFVASVYGEIRGIPGVCFAIIGPGATNLTSGVAYAYLERAPLIAITERYENTEYENCYTQKFDQRRMFSPITKASYIVHSTTAFETTQKALRLAMEGVPGPVHLDFPKDEATRESKCRSVSEQLVTRLSDLDITDGDALQSVCKTIDRYRRPVIVAGIEAKRAGAGREIEALAEALDCPLMVSLKGRGAINESHPLYGGLFLGSFSKGTFEDQIIGKSDLLILVGVDLIELLPRKWGYRGAVIHVGSQLEMGCYYGAVAELIGNIKVAARGLLKSGLHAKDWDAAEIDACRCSSQQALTQSNDSLPLHHIVSATRAMLPADGVLCTDIGAFNSIVHYLWKVTQPNTYFTTKGLSTMAFSLPAAIGAQLAMPSRRVVCFIGDGSMLMGLPNLALCSQLNLPITIVVFSDGALGLIKVKQLQAGMEPVGVDLKNPDFAKLAESFGGAGYRVKTKSEFDKAIAGDRFSIVEAVLNPNAYPDLIAQVRGSSGKSAQ